jgi:hypothetical protein
LPTDAPDTWSPPDSEDDYGDRIVHQATPVSQKVPELVIAEPADEEIDIPPRVYVVPRFIQRGVVTEIIGPAGQGKSQLFITWATALALGLPVGDFVPPYPMRVINLDVEDDITEQQKRVAATLRLFNREKPDLEGRLKLVCPSKEGLMLRLSIETRRITHTPALDELIALIGTFHPDIVFLNPLGELHDSDENDNSSLRRVVAELRVIAKLYDIAVVFAHHTPKSAATPGDQNAGRGAGSIGGVVRKAYTLFSMTKTEGELFGIAHPEFYFRLDGAKSNYDAKNATGWYERVIYDLDNGDAVAAAWPWQPPAGVVDPAMVDELVRVISVGCLGRPWSARLGKYDRSISQAMETIGIAGVEAQRKLLDAVRKAGVEEHGWRKANRALADGLRCPDGSPSADWVER